MTTVKIPQDRKPAKKAPAKKVAAPKVVSVTDAPEAASVTRARRASELALAAQNKAPRDENSKSAAEIAEELDTPTERPAGLPELRPLVSLGRRDRAGFYRSLAEIQKAQPHLVKIQDIVDDERAAEEFMQRSDALDTMADLADLAAAAEELLVFCAADQVGFKAWAQKAGDDVLVQAFSWYMQENPLGEASPSES